jgi:hypothetical protein
LLGAVQDMQNYDGEGYEEGESLEEAESEIGMDDWIYPETGQPAEDMPSHRSDEVVIRNGDVIEAVRASISVPGIFTPVRSNGPILVDGGLTNPVPVSAVRAMGADIVIAVDLNPQIIVDKNLKPSLGHICILEFGRAEEIIAICYEHARRQLGERGAWNRLFLSLLTGI